MFHLFLYNIDWEILDKGGMRFEKSFKYYSNDQWLLCREHTWFNMVHILHALMLNRNIIDEMIIIKMRNRSLKGEVKQLITFIIFRDDDTLLDDALVLQI